MLPRDLLRTCLHQRGYASIVAAPSRGAIKIDPAIFNQQSVKPPGSRKSTLHADYVAFVRRHGTLLLLQHNNLSQADLLKLRTELKAIGARVRILRVGLFQHAVRVADLTREDDALKALDVNSKQIYKLAKRRRTAEGLRLTELLAGPICAITFEPSVSQEGASTEASTEQDALDGDGAARSNAGVAPETLSRVMALVKATNNKLMLLGGKVDETVFAYDSLQRISQLPPLPVLQGQLLGLLGASAQRLVAILGSPAQRLTATVDGRRVQLEEEASSESKSTQASSPAA